MECPKCNHKNRDGAKFCEECGTKLQSICPNCGSKLRPQAKFCDECGTKISEAEAAVPTLEDMHSQSKDWIPDELAEKYMAAEKQATGENRPITALFADISGFTPLSNSQSSETMFQLVQDAFKGLVGIVARYEGSISGFRGDGLLALFGAPILHENDAERAILAALNMREKIQEHDLQVSIGINTAMMTVGEVQTQLHSEYTAYGTDINLAKRLQEAAKPGQILVGTGTHRLTRRIFDFDIINELSVKGFTQTVTAYAVQQVKEHPEKLRGIEGLRARMIGREHEFADLKDATDSWLNGQGQIVSIIGEAGIGKSRLVRELREYLDESASPLSILEGRCVSIGQPISYWPFLDILRTYFGLGEDDDEATRARKVTEPINQLMPQSADEALPLLGNLLSIKFGNELDDRLKFAGPEQIRHQTLMRLRDIFDMLSRQQPLLLILEDLHWADDLSLDLISLLMDELARTPLMLLCVYRPEKEHRVWQLGDQARRKCLDRYTELTLHPLSSHQSRLLVESLLEIENLPESTRDTILTKSEGNPFFIEEVIRSLIEQDLVYREGDNWKARDEIENISVPDTIQSVVLARVDRLQSEAKYVLQCASIIGRLFRYRLLKHISRQEQELDQYIDEFEDRELIYEERTVPELEYAFKHAFTQEATYEGILERKRREFHQQVAESIERLYQERLEEYYEELAHHNRLGGNDEKAIEYLLKSGIKAANNFLNQDALLCFNQTEQLLEKSPKLHRKENMILHERRGGVLQLIGRWIEAIGEYEEALKWADDCHDRAGIYQKMGWLECAEIQDRTGAIRHFELGLNELSDNDRSTQYVRLQHDITWAQMGRLELDPAPFPSNIRRCQQAAEIAKEMGYHRELAIIYAAIERWHSGMGNYSDEYGKEAIAIGEKLQDPSTLAWIFHVVGATRLYFRSGKRFIEESIPYFRRAVEVSESIGDVQIHSVSLSALGHSYQLLGQDNEAIESYTKALDIGTETKSIVPLVMASLSMRIYAKLDQADMVLSTFARIMRALAKLDIDEESQGWALIMGNLIYDVYWEFQSSYRDMGKESEYFTAVREVLEELLGIVESRPQKAWYHRILMSSYIDMGNKEVAESHAKAIVSIVDKMGCPDYMVRSYPAYLFLGNTETAAEMTYRLVLSLGLHNVGNVIGTRENSYRESGHLETFECICEQIEREQGDKLQQYGVNQIRLKSVDVPYGFPITEFEDTFGWKNTGEVPSPWKWIDDEGASNYSLSCKPQFIEICPAVGSEFGYNGSDSAPRFSQTVSGDFAIEAGISGEGLGGIFIMNCKEIITFQQNPQSQYSWIFIDLVNHNADRSIKAGHGCLETDFLVMRLERKGCILRAYCSGDKRNWYRCGWTEMEMEDPVHVGIFSRYFSQRAITFHNFRILRER